MGTHHLTRSVGFSPDYDGETIAARLSQSRQKKFLCDTVSRLLAQAPVTEMCKKEVLTQFALLSVEGIAADRMTMDQEDDTFCYLMRLVRLDTDADAELFFPDETGAIEAAAYAVAAARYLITATAQPGSEFWEPLTNTIGAWKRQYIEKYGHPPLEISL